MAISLFTDSIGTTLNSYTLKETGETDREVQLVFNPSSDYVAGTTFCASTMNPIINAVNQLTNVITGTLSTGSTSITITDTSITTSSILSFYTSIYGVNPKTVTVATGSVTLTFEEQSSDMTVGVRVDGTI